MHCYLVAKCKTPDCKGKFNFSHTEVPDVDYGVIDYPDEWFPRLVTCGLCGQTHSYEVKEIHTETSQEPRHPPDWQGIPRPTPKTREIN